jgi:hypothetical protein
MLQKVLFQDCYWQDRCVALPMSTAKHQGLQLCDTFVRAAASQQHSQHLVIRDMPCAIRACRVDILAAVQFSIPCGLSISVYTAAGVVEIVRSIVSYLCGCRPVKVSTDTLRVPLCPPSVCVSHRCWLSFRAVVCAAIAWVKRGVGIRCVCAATGTPRGLSREHELSCICMCAQTYKAL